MEGKRRRKEHNVKERRKGRSNKEEERRRAKQGKGNIKRKNRIKVFDSVQGKKENNYHGVE